MSALGRKQTLRGRKSARLPDWGSGCFRKRPLSANRGHSHTKISRDRLLSSTRVHQMQREAVQMVGKGAAAAVCICRLMIVFTPFGCHPVRGLRADEIDQLDLLRWDFDGLPGRKAKRDTAVAEVPVKSITCQRLQDSVG